MKSTIRRSIVVAGCLAAFANFTFALAQTDVSTAAELQAAIDNGDSEIVLTAPISVTTPINIGTTSSPLLTIDGNGNAITGSTEIFFIQSGNVTISNTTLTGAATGGSGSTAEAAGGGALGSGGAIFVGATANVTASNVQFSNNSATGGHGGTGTINGTFSGGGGMNGGTGSAASGGGGGGGGGNGGAGGGGSVGAGGGGGGLNSAGGTGFFQNGGAGGGPNGGSGGNASSAGDGGINSGGGGGNFQYGNDGGNGGTNGGGGGAGEVGNGGNGGSYGGGGAAAAGGGGNGGFGGGGGGGDTGAGNGGFGAGGGGNLNGAGGTGGVGAGNGAPGTGGSSAGGGGAGLGGAVFEQAGGEFIITGSETFGGNSVAGGTGANNGAAAGSDIFVMTGAGIIIAPGTDNTITLNGTIADDSAVSLPGGSYTAGTASGVGIQFGSNTSVSGTVVLNGANTFSGGGTITNATVVEAGSATALGTGPITNATGVLTVTLSNHSIVLNGYTQDSLGALGLYVNGHGASATPDLLHITNTSSAQATLDGSLVVNFSGFTARGGGGPERTLDLTVVQTDAGYTGTFTAFDSLGLTGAAASLLYAGNNVDIQLALPASVFSMAGLNSNERGVLSAINSGILSGSSSPGLSALSVGLDRLPTTAVGGALDELSPAKFNQFASTTAINNEVFAAQDMDIYLQGLRDDSSGGFACGAGQLDTSGLVVNDPIVDPGLQMIHSRMLAWNDLPQTISDVPGAVLGGVDMKDMKACPGCKPTSKPWDFFLRGNVILAQGFSQGDVPHFDDNSESVVAGADYHFTPHFLAGLTAGYAHTDATLDDFGSSATVDSYSPGVYASYADSGWYANFLGRYSYNSYTEQRNITFLGQTASGATDGHEGTASLDGGYNFHSGALTYGPIAGLQYTHLTVNSYGESGSDAALAVQEDQTDSLRSRLGGTVSYDWRHSGMVFRPHLEATWQHEFMDQSRGITSQFTAFNGGSFTVRTDSPSQDSALVDAGLDAQIDDTFTVFADYLVEAGQSDYFGQSVQAGVKINF